MTPDSTEKRQVLFVEDSVDHALLVQTFFSGLPEFAVTHTQDGDHALRLLEERGFDLLVADLNLPGADGFQVIRAAKAKDRHMPVLATTGYTQEHYWDQAFRAGADQVMVKPLDRDDFVGRVRSMVGPRGTETARASPERETVLVVEGLIGDGIMGCAGVLGSAVAEGAQVVILPIPVDPPRVDPDEFAAARAAARGLGFTLRLAESLVGDPDAMAMMLHRAVHELRPSVMYAPARGDRHPSRSAASRIAVEAAEGRVHVFGYQTATSPSAFSPHHVVDIADRISGKTEALEQFSGLGTERPDLDPELARAYARYWGRLKSFGEVEVFETIQEKG
ncbi:MAG: response regulator [Gemmatimonadota bacterium]|nr:response regulator [Gemmatimonadota bacterium]